MNAKLLKKDLDYLKANDGLTTIFWVTHYQARAVRITWLEKHGYIKRIDEDKHVFPTMRFAFPKELKDVLSV